MTRVVVCKPNGDPPFDESVDVELPNGKALYRVSFYLGRPSHVTSQFWRAGKVRYDWAGRERGRGSSACITKSLWGSWMDEEPTGLAKKLIAEATKIRSERYPVVIRAARLLDVQDHEC